MHEKDFAGLLALLALPQAYADEVRVSKAWVRTTAPVQLNITSRKDAALIRVTSGSVQSGEIHGMDMEGDAMKMRILEELPLPAKTTVSLGAESRKQKAESRKQKAESRKQKAIA